MGSAVRFLIWIACQGTQRVEVVGENGEVVVLGATSTRRGGGGKSLRDSLRAADKRRIACKTHQFQLRSGTFDVCPEPVLASHRILQDN